MHSTARATLHDELRTTLEEADHYYTLMIEAGEHPNLDRLGYASHITLDVFRRLLARPDLHADELAAMLREAVAETNAHAPIRVPRPVQVDLVRPSWPDTMARFIVARANEN